jgi:predicted PurR-regulated permease PerM
MHNANESADRAAKGPSGTQEAGHQAAGRRRRTRRLFAAALALLGLWVARDYLVALAWAILIALAAWPLYRRFAAFMPERRTLASAVFTMLASLVLLVPLALIAVEVGRETQTALRWLAEAQQSGIPAPDWLAGIPVLGRFIEVWWHDHLAGPAEAKALLEGIDRGALATWSQSLGREAAYRLLLLLITFMALFLLLRDGEHIAGRVSALVDRALGGPGDQLAGKLVHAVHGTVSGTVLVALGEGVLIGAGYVTAGVPNAVLFALLTAAFAMLPLGAWIAFSAAALTLLSMGGSAFMAAGVFVWGAMVMLAGDNFVQPALIGGAARLPFLWALIGILGGLGTFGLVGLFLGPVIMAAVLTVWREWLDRDLLP